jgi:hypothetical protein
MEFWPDIPVAPSYWFESPEQPRTEQRPSTEQRPRAEQSIRPPLQPCDHCHLVGFWVPDEEHTRLKEEHARLKEEHARLKEECASLTRLDTTKER